MYAVQPYLPFTAREALVLRRCFRFKSNPIATIDGPRDVRVLISVKNRGPTVKYLHLGVLRVKSTTTSWILTRGRISPFAGV